MTAQPSTQQSSNTPASPPVPAQRRRWPWAVGAAVALFVAVGVANGGNQSAAPTTTAPTASAAMQVPAVAASSGRVIYEVTGASRASNITWMTGKGMSMAQVSSARLPWRQEVQASGEGFFVPTLTAQNSGSGTLTCRITVDGAVVAEVTSEGAYAVAMCAADSNVN